MPGSLLIVLIWTELKNLSGIERDIETDDYQRLKKQFYKIRSQHSKCKFLYLLGKNENGEVFFFLDSQKPGSEDYAKPGLIYNEVSQEYLQVFQETKPKTVGPVKDRWGKLYTALIPITDQSTGTLKAVMGMDVTANDWNMTIFYDVIKIAGVLFLSIILVYYAQQVRFLKNKKEADKKIKQSEEKFRNIYNNANDAIFIHNIHDGRIVDVNVTMLKIYGYDSADEVINKSVSHFSSGLPPYTYENAKKHFNECKQSGESQLFKWHSRKKDGSLFWVEVSLAIVTIVNKKRVLVIARDITIRQKAQESYKIIADRYQTLFDQAADGILIGNKEGVITNANSSICEITGYGKAELIGNSISILFSGNTLDDKPLRYDLVHQGAKVLNERELIRKDGTIVFIEMNTKKVADNILQAYIRDITSRKKSQKMLENKNLELLEAKTELQKINDMLSEKNEQLKIQKIELENAKYKAEESDRLKTAFLANISHEIRTPMNGIIGFTQLLQTPGANDSSISEFADVIKASSRRMLDIINDIISISKIESGEMRIFRYEMDVNFLFNDLKFIFSTQAEKKNIELKVHHGKRIFQIISDETKFHQIIKNLLKNAIKFTESGSVEFGYKVEKEELIIFVKDTGIGIEEEILDKIFDRFRQAETSIARKYEGAGLGLSITKAYVDLLGGKIKVRSKIGEGSEFIVILPLSEMQILKIND